MACYLVISSRHLSNGHYRGIKGVFRGPLCKKGSGSPAAATSSLPSSIALRTDYAEKEKAAAKALEDVKANFYCELCDKQYHKHHEFDNHINSYDHAHKQRLKDLKQREFARNVASKSWKDEKKQEKALKRLHQLAELRKQSACISRSGPLLKAPRLVVEKQHSSDGILLCKGGKVPASSQRSSRREGQGFSSSVLGKQQLIISRHQSPTERAHRTGGHISQVFPDSTNTSPRAGVSFSFSKKVPLKLESSASLFSENSEEGTDCSECLSQKAKQALEGCRSGMLLEEEGTASLDKGPAIMQNPMDLENSASSHGAANPKVPDNDKSSDGEAEDKVSAHPSFSKAKTQLSNMDFSGLLRAAGQESSLQEPEQLPAALPPAPCPDSTLCPQPSSFRHSNAHLPGQLPELLQQPVPRLACARSSSDGAGVMQRERPAESSKSSSGSMEALPREAEEVKPQALPFLQVVSKDGSTALQWPTELLLFTKTEPCISYGCNPLYFDFRLSVHPRDGKQQEAHKAICKGHPQTQTADENQASGLMTHKQTSNQADCHLSKPKKMKDSLNPRRAKQKTLSDVGNEGDGNGQKCIPECLNENPPKVPAHLEVSHNDDMAEKCLQATALSPSKHLVHSCEGSKQSIRNESISFSAFIARVRKAKAARCPLLYSEEKPGHQNDCRALPASCSSDISDSSKDSGGSFLCSKSTSSSRCSETEGCGSSMRCWRCPSPPKSSCERHSCSSDSSVSSTRNYLSYMSPASNQHSRDHPLVCCKRQSKRAGRHRCRHRKHRCGVPSADTGEAWLCPSRSHRSRKWAQGGTVKYGRCSIHSVLQHRDRSKHSRCGHQHLGKEHSRSRSYQSSKSCSTRDSRSSERSSSRVSRGSSSGSFSKEADNGDNQTKEDTERGSSTKLGEEGTTQDGHGNGQSKALATCSSETLAEDVCGRRKSLTAQLLLDRVQAKKSQEQMRPSERLPSTCGVGFKGHSQSHFALQFAPSVGDIAALPLPEELLSVAADDRRHQDTGVKRGSAEAPELRHAALAPGTDCDHCLLQDIIQLGAGCQSPRRSTAIQDPPHLFFSEVQPFLEGCEQVPNDFPGAFPSSRYSVVAHSIETKEELPAVAMDSSQAEGSWDSLCGRAVQHYGDTVSDIEGYSKSTSPPLTQQPVTFSPEEVDKYRLLQLQAQQHIQKQLLAKQLKVLPSPGPAPAAPALPVQQQATVTTIHHTLLQHFAVSASLHPHGSHLSLAHLHPLSQAHFVPVSLSPLSPALLPSHPALLAGHPLHLVSSSPLHTSPLLLPMLPHTAYIPALFTPHLSVAPASALHPAPLAQPLLQSQEHHHHSCSSQTQHLPSVKEVFSVSRYLT
ncbi:zinc finger protein 804B [Indicator indicator]|uniref:zinc finger protein 804B n=1 Tax=Indicator indicator TaxID=1002788 RepID=UPI0023DEB812|nr:zinc finger protein 804B [Indicator indicator]